MSDGPEPDGLDEAMEQEPAEVEGGAEQMLREAGILQRAAGPVADFVRNSPFLCASLAVHIVVLVLLAFLTAQEPRAQKKRIVIQMEDITAEEVEMQPMQREENLTTSLEAGSVAAVGAGAENESYETAAERTEKVDVPKVNILGLTSPTGAGTGGEWAGYEGEGMGAMVPGSGMGGVEGAVDQFAVITLNSMQRGKTLVVLLIDRSASVLYGDLPTIIKRMDNYFEAITKNLPEGVEERGRWVVVSFGEQPSFECEPTADLEQIKSALRSVESDRSGKENVAAAIELVLTRVEGGGYKYLLFAAMTDEAGDDIYNPVVLERTIKRIRQAKGRFFVFGYESTFCARQKRVSIPVMQMKGRDLAEYKAYADATGRKLEQMVIHGWADGGPECPRPELWWTESWQNWQHWGGSFNNIPSGFGMYALNRMALATDGIYFLLKAESNYDEEKLYARYKPDICSVFTYRERMEQVALRRRLYDTWLQMKTFHLPHDLRNNKQINQMLDRSRNGREYCIGRAQELRSLLNSATPTGDNWTRWQAHAEVTIAELLRFRFMLGQYHEALRQEWTKHGKQVPPKKRYVIGKGKAPSDFIGGAPAKAEFDMAAQYIESLIARHKGTPWETMGKRLQKGRYPWKCSFTDVPKPGPPPDPNAPAPPPAIVP